MTGPGQTGAEAASQAKQPSATLFVCQVNRAHIAYLPDADVAQWCRICHVWMIAHKGDAMDEQPTAGLERRKLVEPPMPEGGREATGLHEFLTVDESTPWGSMWTGLLAGVTQIKNRDGKQVDRYLLKLDDGKIVVLPSHRDLDRRMRDVLQSEGEGARIVIGYLGITEIEGVATPMYQYKVKAFGVEKSDS